MKVSDVSCNNNRHQERPFGVAWRGVGFLQTPRSVTHGLGMLRNHPVLSSRMLVMCLNRGHYTLRLITA
jgi:hypothetical protein